MEIILPDAGQPGLIVLAVFAPAGTAPS